MFCTNVALGEQHSSSSSSSPPPRIITRVQVTLHGDVYYVDDVTTVEMLQRRLWEESGYTQSQQGVVYYQGQLLSQPTTALSDVGVQDSGDVINMIPTKVAQHWKVMNEMKLGLHKLHLQITTNDNDDDYNKKEQQQQRKEDLKVLLELYNDMTNKIPYMQEEMDEFMIRMRYPISLQYANDPDRIEKLRQIIMNNPMLVSHIMINSSDSSNTRAFGTSGSSSSSSSTSSSLGYILQDKRKWRQLVQRSVGRWKTMSAYQMWQLLVRDGNLFDNSMEDGFNGGSGSGSSKHESNVEEYEDDEGMEHTHAEEEEDEEEEEEEEEE